MDFCGLPDEIIIEVVENLAEERDIYSLIRVSRRFHDLFDDHLHCHNIKYRNCRALRWAAEHGREPTARKLLHLGADVNVRFYKARNKRSGPRVGLTPLHTAASKGRLALTKLLLEFGADPEARAQDSSTPLLLALVARHEEIARTIFRHTRNPQDCLVDPKLGLTPLHVSCRLGLWNCARVFLNEGADVNAIDASAMTPLHHALISDFNGGNSHHGPDEIFKTVKVLMEFGANQNVEGPPRYIGEKPITARERGVIHPYGRVRALFSNRFGDSLHNASETRTRSRHISRAWMLPTRLPICATERDGLNLTEHVDTERFFHSNSSSQTSKRDQKQPDSVLDSANQPHISSLKTHCSGGLWAPTGVDSLIAGFSVGSEPGTAPLTEQSSQVFHFPELDSHISKKSPENEASKSWTDFGRSQDQPVAEEEFFDSASSERSSPQRKPRTKERGKTRWQPLKF